ncbi:MAG: DUF4440 domain-containing protein [Gammaproteobacteria bacterium]|nr:DUF4440 domain-containing protein [Gammaproteobacteria bacterium]
MQRLIVPLALLLTLAACGQQSAPPADGSVLTARSAAWEAALNAKDLDALVDLYTSDARLLAPNREMGSGAAAVRAEFGAMIDAGLRVDLTSIDARVAGDMGHNVGTYTLLHGDTVVDSGKFVETWQRGDDGQWRIANDIYNSDLPVAAPEMPMEGHMTHVMIVHEVDDAERWMEAWRGEDSRHSLFKDNGAAHVHTLLDTENPNLAGLIVAVRDMDAMQAMLRSEEGVAAATADGVKLDTMRMLFEAD